MRLSRLVNFSELKMSIVQLTNKPQNGLPAKPVDGTFFMKQREKVVRDNHLLNPVLSTFQENDLYYHENSLHFRKKEDAGRVNKFFREHSETGHLLVSIYFFIRCIPKIQSRSKTTLLRNADDSNVDIVFFGIHPADHIDHLVDLFPHFNYHLYDIRPTKEDVDWYKKIVKHRDSKNVFLHRDTSTYEEQFRKHKESSKKGRSVYLIADHFNLKSGTVNSKAEDNSALFAEDMTLQLNLARKIDAKFSMLRFRVQDEKQRQFEGGIVNKVSLKYPPGRLLKMPLVEQNKCFLICEDYRDKSLIDYYHDDMLDMFKYHNIEVARTFGYVNPFTGLFEGYIGIEMVKQFMEKHFPQTLKASPEDESASASATSSKPASTTKVSPSFFICGMGWHHRAMLYIITMFLAYLGEDLKNTEAIQERVTELILRPWISMEASKLASLEARDNMRSQ